MRIIRERGLGTAVGSYRALFQSQSQYLTHTRHGVHAARQTQKLNLSPRGKGWLGQARKKTYPVYVGGFTKSIPAVSV